MTERATRHVDRGPHHFAAGPSAWSWRDGALEITIDERATPLPRLVLGAVRVKPLGLCNEVIALDAPGRHRWGPIAPGARVEVDLQSPALRWQGHGYLDSNEGDEPIDAGFTQWDWLRAPLSDGSTAVIYELQPRQGPARLIARRFGAGGASVPLEAGARHSLPATGWRVGRGVRSEGGLPVVVRTLEDTPFYARSLVRTRLAGQSVLAMHESLSATRFAAPWVQTLLPWRMPRRR